jgi:hypothetical protein
MTKRVVAGLLWLFAGWYAGAMIAFLVGLSVPLGLILGVGLAVFITADPGHRIWARQSPIPQVPVGLATQTITTKAA